MARLTRPSRSWSVFEMSLAPASSPSHLDLLSTFSEAGVFEAAAVQAWPRGVAWYLHQPCSAPNPAGAGKRPTPSRRA